MPEIKLIKWMLSVLMLVCMLTLGVTSYSIHQSEVSNKAFAERVIGESKQREQQLALKLNMNIQHQVQGLRENFISWQIDQVTQTRKLISLEVSGQLRAEALK